MPIFFVAFLARATSWILLSPSLPLQTGFKYWEYSIGESAALSNRARHWIFFCCYASVDQQLCRYFSVALFIAFRDSFADATSLKESEQKGKRYPVESFAQVNLQNGRAGSPAASSVSKRIWRVWTFKAIHLSLNPSSLKSDDRPLQTRDPSPFVLRLYCPAAYSPLLAGSWALIWC